MNSHLCWVEIPKRDWTKCTLTTTIFRSIGLFILFQNVEVLFDMTFLWWKSNIWCWTVKSFELRIHWWFTRNSYCLIAAAESCVYDLFLYTAGRPSAPQRKWRFLRRRAKCSTKQVFRESVLSAKCTVGPSQLTMPQINPNLFLSRCYAKLP
jgi:hypothetical protein